MQMQKKNRQEGEKEGHGRKKTQRKENEENETRGSNGE